MGFLDIIDTASSATLYKRRSKFGGIDASLMAQVGFFVAPLLDWGMRTEIDDPTKATFIDVDIANVNLKKVHRTTV